MGSLIRLFLLLETQRLSGPTGAGCVLFSEAAKSFAYVTTSLPLFESSGSVQAERLKQQGRRLPVLIFEMLTATRRSRVNGFSVALIHRTHSCR
jgi:hypothetical protein